MTTRASVEAMALCREWVANRDCGVTVTDLAHAIDALVLRAVEKERAQVAVFASIEIAEAELKVVAQAERLTRAYIALGGSGGDGELNASLDAVYEAVSDLQELRQSRAPAKAKEQENG